MHNILLYITFLTFLIHTSAFCQKSPEDRFEQARLLSSEEKYSEAIGELDSLIIDFPNNLDYKIYLGRVYNWSGRYNEAYLILQPIVNSQPENEEAIAAFLKTLLWSGRYDEVIKYADLAIKRHRENKLEYQLIKLQAFAENASPTEGLALVDSLRGKFPNNKRLIVAETDLLKKQKNDIRASYTNTYFTNDEFDPWHLGSISYSRNWKKIPTEFRFSYAHLFKKNDIQFEADMYPVIGNYSYLYINLGIAPKHTLFPFYRAGLEYFYEFPTGTSFSAGSRLLRFKDETIPMITGHIGKSFRDYNVQYRPIWVFNNNQTFPTHTVAIKKNWFSNEASLQLDLQYGTTPYFLFITDDFDRVSSKRIGIQSRFRLDKNLLVKMGIMYEHEEYSPQNFRRRFNSQIILHKRF